MDFSDYLKRKKEGSIKFQKLDTVPVSALIIRKKFNESNGSPMSDEVITFNQQSVDSYQHHIDQEGVKIKAAQDMIRQFEAVIADYKAVVKAKKATLEAV